MGNNDTIVDKKRECILSFDKHHLTLGLDKLTQDADVKIKHIQDNKESIIRSGFTNLEVLISIHNDFKRDVDITRKRLENTPICE